MNCNGSIIEIGDDAWLALEKLISELHDVESKIFILADENTAEMCLPILEKRLGNFSQNLIIIDSGEASKNLEIAYHLWEEMLEEGADRQTVLINLGGGVVTDLGGFVASTFKRGIPFINIPTSLLAMVDAAIGGKTGIDLGSAKNQVGTFAWPDHVFIIPEFLKTLAHNNLLSGFGECVKHGLLHGSELFEKVLSQDPVLFDETMLNTIVKVKVDVVNEDPNEADIRKSLNLGHTIGHAIESVCMDKQTPILHGEAVLLGLLAELRISELKFGLDPTVLHRLSVFLETHYPDLKGVKIDGEALYPYMNSDKKNVAGEIRFALLEKVGECKVDESVAPEILDQGLEYLKQWQAQ